MLSTNGPKDDHLLYDSASSADQQMFLDKRLSVGDPRLRQSTRLLVEWGDPMLTLMVIDRGAPLLAWLTLHDKGASKDEIIQTLTERYGPAEREIVVFGDHVNDVSMLRAAHRGIAMGNAIDAVNQEAHTVIGSHLLDSVVEFIESDCRS